MKTSVNYKHLAIVAAATVLPLLPFLDKAFHIDDPLFLWTAKQILKEPWNFYGFTGNWFGLDDPAYVFIKNPPFASYYIAFIAYFAGFTEIALHTAFLVPAIAVALGTYVLASRFTIRPLMAALAAIATPGFLVSSTTIMCDVMMLAFWVWAVYFWMKGVDEGRPGYLALGGVLVALASMTKYFGISLIPLLALYSIMKGKKGIRHLLFLLIPIAVLGSYHFYTEYMYGWGLLLDASAYASGVRGKSNSGVFEKAFAGIVFSGGCTVAVLFLIPSVWGRRAVFAGVICAAMGAMYAYWKGGMAGFEIFSPVYLLEYVDGAGWADARMVSGNANTNSRNFVWGYIAQFALYTAAGSGILALTIKDIVKRMDAESVLLALWVAGTIVFAVYVNWTINARSVLPMIPAVAILVMRAADDARLRAASFYVPLALSLSVSFVVAWADYTQAQGVRRAADNISAYNRDGKTLWFRGHWGFKYYMEGTGARPLISKSQVMPGDIIVVPSNNTGKKILSNEFYMVNAISLPRQWVNTMNSYCGAGFYSNIWGPLPYVLSPDCKESYYYVFVNEAS